MSAARAAGEGRLAGVGPVGPAGGEAKVETISGIEHGTLFGVQFRIVLLSIFLATLACTLPGLEAGVPSTPLFRTATPAGMPAPTSSGIVFPTETPLGVFPPTRTPDPFATPTLSARDTETPTPTHTATPAAGEPLVIHYVEPVEVRHDPSRPNGALVTLRIVFSGGAPPYTFYHQDEVQLSHPFDVPSACSDSLVATVRVDSADGQSASQAYFVSVICPP